MKFHTNFMLTLEKNSCRMWILKKWHSCHKKYFLLVCWVLSILSDEFRYFPPYWLLSFAIYFLQLIDDFSATDWKILEFSLTIDCWISWFFPATIDKFRYILKQLTEEFFDFFFFLKLNDNLKKNFPATNWHISYFIYINWWFFFDRFAKFGGGGGVMQLMLEFRRFSLQQIDEADGELPEYSPWLNGKTCKDFFSCDWMTK